MQDSHTSLQCNKLCTFMNFSKGFWWLCQQSGTGSVPVHKWRDGRGDTYWGGGTYCLGPTEEAFLHFSALNFICSAGELRRKYDLIPLAPTATCLHKRDCDHRVTGITSAQQIPKERRSVVSALRLARRKRRCDIIRFIHKELQQTVNCKPSVNTMRYPSVESAVCWLETWICFTVLHIAACLIQSQ